MSVETIAIVISAVSLLLGFVGAFVWMITRTDARFDRLERGLGERIAGVERELVEVKISVARIEGPPRRFLSTR